MARIGMATTRRAARRDVRGHFCRDSNSSSVSAKGSGLPDRVDRISIGIAVVEEDEKASTAQLSPVITAGAAQVCPPDRPVQISLTKSRGQGKRNKNADTVAGVQAPEHAAAKKNAVAKKEA